MFREITCTACHRKYVPLNILEIIFSVDIYTIITIFIISFFLFMPFVALAYIALVLLVPAESSRYEYVVEREVRCRRRRMTRRERKRAQAEEEAREQRAVERPLAHGLDAFLVGQQVRQLQDAALDALTSAGIPWPACHLPLSAWGRRA